MPRVPRDLPAAARRGPDVRRRGGARALSARPRRLAPVPVAVVRGARRLHARLRRDRPGAVLGRARRRGRVPGARGGRVGRRARAAARHRPEPHGGRRRQPLLVGSRSGARSSSTSTRRPAATAASSTSTISPASARRTPRCSPRRTRSRSGWCARGWSTGCGSTIPTGSRTRRGTSSGCATAAPDHVWVEKILDPGERLRDWPVEGTVGYEFLNDAAALFVDPAGEAPLTALWTELAGDARPFGDWAAEAKAEQAATTFAPDLDRLRRDWPERHAGSRRRSRRSRSTAPTSATCRRARTSGRCARRGSWSGSGRRPSRSSPATSRRRRR